MTKFNVALIFTLALLASYPLKAQKKNKKSDNVEQVFAHITYDSILVNLKEYPKLVKLIEAYQKQLVSEYEVKSLEFETLLDDYKEKEESLPEQEAAEKMQQLQGLNKELEQMRNEFEQKIFDKEKELLKPLNEKIQKAIKEVASEQGYTHVVEKKNFYYIDTSFDATELIINKANNL